MKKASKGNKQKIQTIIFDFDDTLANSSAASAYASGVLDIFGKYRFGVDNFGKVFDSYDVIMTKKARTTKDVGLLHRRLWALETAKKFKLKLSEKDIAEIVHLYWYSVFTSIKAFPHTTKTLAALKKKCNLFVLSDVDGNALIKVQKMKLAGVYKFFKGFALGDILNTTKPDVKYYQYLISHYGINPKTTMMVGDRPNYDLLPAKKLGMKTVWLKQGRWQKIYKTTTFKYVDHTISDIKQLEKLL